MRLIHSRSTVRAKIAASVLAIGAIIAGTAAGQTLQSAGIDTVETRRPDRTPDGRGNFPKGTPPRFSTTTPAVPAGNGINYHGGAVLHTVNLYYVFYGNWEQKSLNATGTTLLVNWAQNIGGTPYFNINASYADTTGDVPNVVTYKGAYSDSGSLGMALSDSNIGTLVVNAINSGQLGTKGVADPNGFYLVLTAPGVAETSGFISQYCGWHSWGTLGTTNVQYGYVGDAAGPKLANCADQMTSSPNNDPGVDGMISVLAHELSESATDPRGNAWYDANGEENGDKCAWNFGTAYRAVNGSAANVNVGGKDYLMQQIWLNAQGGKCALSYVATPDFGVAVSGSESVNQGQTTGAYTLTAAAVNGFTGTVSWSLSNLPVGVTATPASGLLGNSATFTLTASASAAPGTYSILATGTSGSLTHTVTATLVIVAPSFTLIVNPVAKTVTRPTAGKTTTVAYAVNVISVGTLTKPVTLSASGSITGMTTGVVASITGTNPVTPGSAGVLSVTIGNSAKAGTLTLTVTGTAAGVATKQATTQLTLQ